MRIAIDSDMDSVEVQGEELEETSPLVKADYFTQPVANVPEPSSSLCAIICRTLCCGNKNNAHDSPGRKFPRNPAEFRVLGVAWANSVFAESLAPGNEVTDVEVGSLGAQGLLSELCLATLTYKMEQVDLPKQVVVKFSAAETKTQLTMNIFLLCKSEYLMYTKFRSSLPREIKTPKCFGADFNYTSNKICLMLEKVESTFLDQTARDGEQVPKLEHFKKIFSTLAVLHAHCWNIRDEPGLSWVNHVDGPTFPLFPKEVKKGWGKWAACVADPGFECDGKFYKILTVPEDVSGIRADLMAHYVQLLTDCTQRGGLTSICHGDPRLDNFYYNDDGSVGLLDWQLMAKACVATDISWVMCYHDLPSRFTDAETKGLVSDYFDELQALGGAAGSTLDDLKEQIALAHLFTLGKAVIGTAGLGNSDRHAKQIMHLLNAGVLNNMEIDDTVALFRKYLEGSCEFLQHEIVQRASV